MCPLKCVVDNAVGELKNLFLNTTFVGFHCAVPIHFAETDVFST